MDRFYGWVWPQSGQTHSSSWECFVLQLWQSPCVTSATLAHLAGIRDGAPCQAELCWEEAQNLGIISSRIPGLPPATFYSEPSSTPAPAKPGGCWGSPIPLGWEHREAVTTIPVSMLEFHRLLPQENTTCSVWGNTTDYRRAPAEEDLSRTPHLVLTPMGLIPAPGYPKTGKNLEQGWPMDMGGAHGCWNF